MATPWGDTGAKMLAQGAGLTRGSGGAGSQGWDQQGKRAYMEGLIGVGLNEAEQVREAQEC